jgi:sugar lactone lactonase YvrE
MIRAAWTAALLGLLAAPTATVPARADAVYVSESNNDKVERFSLTGVDLGAFANTDRQPLGLAFDTAGNLYVACLTTIQKFTPAGVGSVFVSTGHNGAMSLAFDTAGNLFASMSNNTIVKFTPAGVRSVFVSTGLNFPDGLAFDTAGNLYVSQSNTIEKFSPTGADLGVFASAPSFSSSLAFDTAGNLYAPFGVNNTIERFTPAGVGSVFTKTTGNVNYLALGPIPEPSSLVLGAIAAAVVGVVAWWRKAGVPA